MKHFGKNEFDYLFQMQGREVLYFAFVNIDDNTINHSRKVYTILQILADIGGLVGSLVAIFAFLLYGWNQQRFVMKYL